ncbi:MAG: S9 family peptidase [Planctomycetota bacterium]
MLTASILAGLLALTAGDSAPNGPHPFQFEDLFAMHRLSDPQPSPDGEWVAYVSRVYSLETNSSQSDIWIASIDGGTCYQLTTSPAQDSGPRWSPDGKRLAFVSTRSGSSQIWTIDPKGGEAQQLSRFPVDVDNVSWSPAGDKLAFTAEVYPGLDMAATATKDEERAKDPVKARSYTSLLFRHWDSWEDGKRSHLFVMPAAGGPALDLMQEVDADCPTRPFGGPEEIGWSGDGSELCFTARMGENRAWTTDIDLYLVPAAGGNLRCITEANEAWDTTPAYSPDGRFIAYLAMQRPGYEADRLRIIVHDRASGAKRVVADAWDRSVGEIAWSPDGKTLYVTADDMARRPLFAITVVSGEITKVVPSHHCTDLRVTAKGELVFCQDSLTSPAVVMACGSIGQDLRALSLQNRQRLDEVLMSTPEEFFFAGAGGDRIHSWLLKPVAFEEGRKVPLAFLVHGGPQGCWSDQFHYRWNPQIYAGAGYAVVAINFHGSTSFGQGFCDSIRGDWGGKPFVDLMRGLDHALATYSFIDPERMGALGASFGGTMINWIAGQTDRFKALACHDGNLDERAAYFMTEELWFPEWDHMGVPWENPVSYEKHNPVNFVQNWKTPMLVIHGALDFRVVDTSGLSTFTALQRRGIPSKLLYFPDETHFVQKPRNSQLWHREVLAWLDQWVKKG